MPLVCLILACRASAVLVALLLVGGLGLPLVISGCGTATEGAANATSKKDDENKSDEKKETAIRVRTGTFERRTIDAVLKVHADLWPVESADVLPEAAGVISAVFKREGDAVRKGEMVIQLGDERLALAAAMKKVLWDQ
jgi:multidrug efflux pump subunit AcrA (membrane-fusion protein)